jgi:hypothetical protein
MPLVMKTSLEQTVNTLLGIIIYYDRKNWRFFENFAILFSCSTSNPVVNKPVVVVVVMRQLRQEKKKKTCCNNRE